jgi:hypothetical protein
LLRHGSFAVCLTAVQLLQGLHLSCGCGVGVYDSADMPQLNYLLLSPPLLLLLLSQTALCYMVYGKQGIFDACHTCFFRPSIQSPL